MNKAKLSLCVVTKDSAADLSRCLTAAQDIVDEIVVVDTGSTDNTKSVATSFGAKVVEMRGDGWNSAVEAAAGDWILCLEAHEVVFKQDMRKLVSFLPKAEADGFILEVRGYTNNSQLDNWNANTEVEGFTGYVVKHSIKLFKNHEKIKFEDGRVDKSIKDMEGMVQFIDDVPVHSYGFVAGDARLISDLEAVEDKNVEQWYQLAVGYLSQGNLAKAMNSFVQVHKLDSAYKHVQRNLGTLYMRGNKMDKALEHYQIAIEQHPDDAAAYNNLGVLFKKKQVWDRALWCFSKVAELLPKDPRPIRALALTYKASGETEKGKELLEKAMKAFSGNKIIEEALDDF